MAVSAINAVFGSEQVALLVALHWLLVAVLLVAIAVLRQGRGQVKGDGKLQSKDDAIDDTSSPADPSGQISHDSQYDFVMKLNSFGDVLDENKGWEFVGHNGVPNEDELPRRITIIGNFKVGKTTLLEKLCGTRLPGDQITHTPGLCWKESKVDERPFQLIDIKGENSPLAATENIGQMSHVLRDKKREEAFMRDVIAEMSDAFVFLVNKIGNQEQAGLDALRLDMMSRNRRGQVKDRLIVVHNFLDVSDPRVLKHSWEEVKNVYMKQGFRVSADNGNSAGVVIESLEKTRAADEPTIRHYYLGRDNTSAGKNNEFVIDLIRRELVCGLSAPDGRGQKCFLDELVDVMSKKVKKHLSYTSDTEWKIVETERHGRKHFVLRRADQTGASNHGVVMPTVRPIEMARFVDDNKGGPHRVFSDESDQVRVEIDMPGWSAEDEQMLKDASFLKFKRLDDTWAVTVDGSGVDLQMKNKRDAFSLSQGSWHAIGTYDIPLNPLVKPPAEKYFWKLESGVISMVFEKYASD